MSRSTIIHSDGILHVTDACPATLNNEDVAIIDIAMKPSTLVENIKSYEGITREDSNTLS